MSAERTTFSRQLVEAAKRHPRRAILAAAILSVLISCYPIVFFGRSFVSANNVPMLYPGIPSLPGHDETETENFKGSDAGAIMWHDVPNSFIQSRALFRDGELPLWNRYNSCGLTLLGQGQSMFGDPLHALVVLAAGEAWAWDLKFLLAKVLFCFGLGLAVYASCRHLPTALLLAFSSGFIGFFAYRFNHPAFFSVCYAPWLLACWLEITRSATVRSAVGWTAGLLLASWAELNSGTAKEAYMLLVSLHGCGFLVFLLAFALKRQAEPAWFYGAVVGASSLGGFLGAVMAPRLRRRFREEALLVAALAVPAAAALRCYSSRPRSGLPFLKRCKRLMCLTRKRPTLIRSSQACSSACSTISSIAPLTPIGSSPIRRRIFSFSSAACLRSPISGASFATASLLR